MYDVPVPVKEALRDGRLKKNIRFVIGEEEWHEVGSFETIGWYSPSTSYGDDKKYTIRDAKTYRFVVDDADHDTYTLYIYKGTDPNWRTVEATSRNTWDITLINEAYAYIEIKSSSGNYYSQVSVQNFFAYTIDNNNLVSESVSIDERMCSGDTLKFGLCEGSSLEFQYFDFPNITGQRIQAFVDVESEEMEYSKIYELKRSLYSLPADGRYKITATSANMANIFDLLFVHGTTTTRMEFTVAQDGHGEIEIPNAQKGDDIFLDYRSGTTPTAEVFQWVHKWHTIPMGFFDVKKCSRQASTGIIKVTAYNKLQSDYLNEKANNRILQTFGFDAIMTVHDIRDILLGSYQIEEDVSELAHPTIDPDGELVVTETVFSDLGAFRFSQLYGVKSPINAYRAGVNSTNTDFHIVIASQHPRVRYENDYIKFDAYTGTLEGLEANIVAFIKKVVNDAQLNKSGDDVINYICQNIGFQKIFSIQPGYQTGYNYAFSTVQWEYEEAHNLPHTVVGPITDKRVQLLTSEARLTLPDEIELNGGGGVAFRFNGTAENVGSYTWSTNYQYYSNSSMTIVAIEPCPYATFSDGTTYDWEIGDIYAIAGWDYSALPTLDKIRFDPVNVEEFTLRDIISAVYESIAQFGQLDRITDLFSGVELNHSRLYPADNLYPSDTLYPDGAAASATKSMYSKLWADEGNVHKWRYLIITYKTLNENNEEVETKLQRTINNDGTDNYNMSDNWLMRNLIWTAEDVGALADSMVTKMQDITWFPFEMWCAGLPYLETGDEIEIPLGEHGYTSYILQRQLKGIQNLQDTYINGTLDIF